MKSLRRKPKAAPEAPTDLSGGTPEAPKQKRTLSELGAELFSLVLSLRVTADLGDVNEARQRINRQLDIFVQEAGKEGCRSDTVENAKFALVALLDEAILNSGWEQGKGAWRIMTLQQEHFKINTAGEEFFTRLRRLRDNLGENREAVEVYFDCLALGFQGRFALFGREKLDELIGEVSRELAEGRKWSMAELSPRWRRPDDFSEVVGEGVPVWVTALFFIPGAGLLILLFSLLARRTAGGAAAYLQGLLQNLG